MRMADVVVMAETGEQVWAGPLTEFLRNNREGMNWREVCGALREGIEAPHGRPEPAVIGGGAAPVFYLSLIEPEDA